MTTRLTAKQAAVLDFMREYEAANDNMPTIPVIAQRFGYASPNAANQHVQALVKHGHLERLAGQVGLRFVREKPCAATQV